MKWNDETKSSLLPVALAPNCSGNEDSQENKTAADGCEVGNI